MGYVEPPELRFDLHAWMSRVPEGADQRSAGSSFIQGPASIVARERRRERMLDQLGATKPVDVFIWERGESPRREATKYGGLPWWPASAPWPTASDGRPLFFVAQLLVAPSRALFPEAAGDVLLFFADDSTSDWTIGDGLHAFWVALDSARLIDRVPVPTPFLPCWGRRLRTVDHPAVPRRAPGADLAVVEGTKLGGVPFRVQPDEDLAPEWYRGALGSISMHEHWPFVDAEDIPHEERFAKPPFGHCWGDMGSVRLYPGPHGTIQTETSFY